MRFSVCFFLTVVLWGVAAWGEGPSEQMFQLSLGDARLEGMPLAWNSQQVVLLGRDGQLWEFSPGDAKDYRKTSGRFRPYGTSELRGMLLDELGRDYEVTGTAHYLVAHPRGMRNQWAGPLSKSVPRHRVVLFRLAETWTVWDSPRVGR